MLAARPHLHDECGQLQVYARDSTPLMMCADVLLALWAPRLQGFGQHQLHSTVLVFMQLLHGVGRTNTAQLHVLEELENHVMTLHICTIAIFR